MSARGYRPARGTVATLAAEFPNDNPALHAGAIWTCDHVVGPPNPERRARPSELPAGLAVAEAGLADPTPEPLAPRSSGIFLVGLGPFEVELDDGGGEEEIVVEDLPPMDDVAIEQSDAPPAVAEVFAEQPADGFATLVATLTDLALVHGSLLAASLVAPLLEGTAGEREAASLTADAMSALVAGGVLTPEGGVTRAFLRGARGWASVLRGESDDLAACGDRTLDEWSADLVARLVGAPERMEALRRELRARGVAAFGLLAA